MADVDGFEKPWEPEMRVTGKSVITFERITNIMETILLHVSKVFYRDLLKENNLEGITAVGSLVLLFWMAALARPLLE